MSVVPRLVRWEGPAEVRLLHRQEPEREILLMANPSTQAARGQLTTPGAGQASVWDPETGTIESIGPVRPSQAISLDIPGESARRDHRVVNRAWNCQVLNHRSQVMRRAVRVVAVTLCLVMPECRDESVARRVAAVLPPGVHIEWDLQRAHREASATRERICLNGLWRWQPGKPDAQQVPDTAWGYFKVPGCWPGTTDYMQKDCQTVYVNSAWSHGDVTRTKAAWYQREFVVPANWSGRRIVLQAEYVNSVATVFVDGQQVGAIRYPAGEIDVTGHCRPGERHNLSILVVALPLQGVMLSYNDTAAAREVEGRVERRGLCGDVFLSSEPAGPRLDDVQIITSVRKSTHRTECRSGGAG